MAPRRKRRKASRKFNVTRALMERRLGVRGWGRSRPFFEWSKTLITRTLGEGHNPGTTTGAVFHLPVNNWNDPLGTLATLVAGTGSLTSNRHPVHHDTAISVGFHRVQVLSWRAKINVNWIGNADQLNDFIVAYTFSENAATEVLLAVGTAARIENMEFQTNPRWTLKRFEADGFRQFKPSSEMSVNINVPNVFEYCKIIAGGHLNIEANNATIGHLLADVGSGSSVPTVQLFCTVVIYTESGLEMVVDSVHVTVAITQRVKIMRDHLGAEDMDDGEVDVHA